MKKITEFKSKKKFLSNYYNHAIKYDGIMYPTNEHAYQAAKTTVGDIKIKISKLKHPNSAKKYGSKVMLRNDWEYVKLDIMYNINKIKFDDYLLKKMLLDTGVAYLEEGNYWHDTFWGVCNGVGKNNLGKILMRIRNEL